jgi:CheY-like chemotaxis protein
MGPSKTTLLVVESNEVLRVALSHVLTAYGYKVRMASDGFAALAEIRDTIPGIVICNLTLPTMSGFDLLCVLRRRFLSVWVIATSSTFSDRDLPLGAIADAFYEKGPGMQSLLSMLLAFAGREPSAAVQKRSGLVSVWIREILQTASGEMFVITPCPECLRTFPHARGVANGNMWSTGCFYCCCVIDYAIVQRRNPLPFQLTDRTSNHNLLDGSSCKGLLS